MSACTLNGVTDAVTAVTNTAPEFGLSKVPESADDPPGYSPVGVPVCFTTTDAAVPVVALPVPDPVVVQYAKAMPLMASEVTSSVTMTTGLDKRTRMFLDSRISMDTTRELRRPRHVSSIGSRRPRAHEWIRPFRTPRFGLVPRGRKSRWRRGPRVISLMRVLILDDHQLFADALVHLLSAEGDVEVIATTRTIAEAERVAAEEQPDVVLIDFMLPDGNGADALGAVKRAAPGQARGRDRPGRRRDARRRDRGRLRRHRHEGSSRRGARAGDPGGGRGEAAIPPELLQRALPGLRGDGAVGGITKRELEVLSLLAEGLSNAAIGERLHISPNTVRNHVQNLLAKLGASSRLEAVSLGVGRGLVRAGPPA